MIEQRCLGKILTISKGKKEALSDKNERESIPYIQIDDLHENGQAKYCVVNKKSVIAKVDDIILAWDGANAGVSNSGLFGAIGSTLAKLSFDLSQIGTRYLSWFLCSKREYLRSSCTGATVPHVQKESLSNLILPLPSLPEQQRVATILDKADSLRKKRKQAIDKLDELLKSVFLDMFGDPVTNPKGWEVSTVGCQCDVRGGKRVPKGDKLVQDNTGYPYIKAGNIKNGVITTKDLEYLTPAIREKLKRYTVNQGDVCITVVGVNIGDIGIVPKELHLANLTENANKLLIKNKSAINKIYLAYYLMMDFVQERFSSQIRSSGVPKLALFRIEEVELMLPPIAIQEKFAQVIHTIEKLRERNTNSYFIMNDQFNALMQRYFG